MTMVWCSVVPVPMPAPSSMPSVISPCPSFACSAFILSANLSGARFNLNAKHTNRGRIQLPAPMCLYPVSVGTKAKMEPMKAVIVGASASWKGPQCELILNKVNGNRPKEQVFQQIDSIFARMHEEELKKPRGRVFCHADSRSLNDSRLAKKNNWKGIPTKLNNVPHSREIRQYFYEDVLGATARALEDGMNRLKVEISIPELNPDMDVYRIGTLMELVRVLALSFADDGKRIKVCVQGSMGEGMLSGMPLQLAGTKRILEFMDWGDKNVIGTFINIGTIGAREVTDKDDMFILVAPQNAMGNCIIGDLQAMVEAANPRPVIVINPRLKDMPSSGGVMQTIGRDKRLEFVASFSNSYHFRLLYKIGTQYPIMGALRMSYPYPYELYKRIDTELGKEKYVELATFSKKPNSEEINDAFDGQTRAKQSTPTGIWDLLNSIL